MKLSNIQFKILINNRFFINTATNIINFQFLRIVPELCACSLQKQLNVNLMYSIYYLSKITFDCQTLLSEES